MLVRLFYISTMREGLGEADFKDILSAARRNNRRLNITGLLIAKATQFAQALEGEESVVLSLYDHILKDDRHGGVVKIMCEEVEERIFPNWEMGFRDLAEIKDLQEIDLRDPKYVRNPVELNGVFRKFVNDPVV